LASHDAVVTPNGDYIAGPVSLADGRTVIEVVVSDYAGNEASVRLEVTAAP
jgi:hypothetical protein